MQDGGKILVDTKDLGCTKFNAGEGFNGVAVSDYKHTKANGKAVFQGQWSGSVLLVQDPSQSKAMFEVVSGNAYAKTFTSTLTVPRCSKLFYKD